MFIIALFYLIISIKSNNIPDENERIILNIYYENNNSFSTKNSTNIDEEAIAYAIYNKSYERIGWDFLAIGTYEKNDNKYKDEDKAYAMGYLEGALTKDRIYPFFNNIKHAFYSWNEFNILNNIKNFLESNIIYMEEMSLKNKNNDIYWENVYNIYKQLQRLYDGYMSVAEMEKKFDYDDFLLLPAFADAIDLGNYDNTNNWPNFKKMSNKEIIKFTLLNSHCSALIKLDENFTDIWFGHNTWLYYNTMIKIFKEYRFISNKNNIKGKTVSFTSYPAVLFSSDDFYYVDSNLLVMETTNHIFNNTLYNLLNPESLLTWVRVILSNRLAGSAEEWTNIFKKENSGTYNDQYMILDLNKINLKKKKILKKSLMIIEQIPGQTFVNDVTEILKKNGYWASYNIPYSQEAYNISGYSDIINKDRELKSEYDYNNCVRAKIFRRDQNKIKTNEDFKNIMRYNDYENDIESNNDPTSSIACRGDLVEEDPECFGTTDSKFISVKEILEGKINIHIIAGQTNVQQPTFSWENTTCNEEKPEKWYHEGVVDTWDFSWVEYKSQLINIKKYDDENSIYKLIIIINSVIGAIILVLYNFCKRLKI